MEKDKEEMMQEGRGAKQIILVRKDLKAHRGKFCAQSAHASLAVFTQMIKENPTEKDAEGNFIYTMKHNVEALDYWMKNRFVKICLAVENEQELVALYEEAKKRGMLCSLITDAGFTEFNGVPTLTTAAIGPAWNEEFETLTKHLKPY